MQIKAYLLNSIWLYKNSKYRLLENSLRNSFITKDIKDGFIQLFCKYVDEIYKFYKFI